jgi:hypothetical protein
MIVSMHIFFLESMVYHMLFIYLFLYFVILKNTCAHHVFDKMPT